MLTRHDDLPYTSERAALRAEVERLGQFDLPVVDRENLSRRLRTAMRAIETARRRPQELSWRHAWAGMSLWHRLGTLVSALIVLSAFCWRIFFAHPESAYAAENATTALMLALLPAFFIGMHAATPLENVVDQRRSLRSALRFARRLQSGARRPRREARGEPFVGPPAVDLLTGGAALLGLAVGRSGHVVSGVAIALVPMLAFPIALARRVRIRLQLPFATPRARPYYVSALVLGVLLMLAAHGTEQPDVLIAAFPLLGFAFFYIATLALAEERVYSRRSFVTRDEQPIQYWWMVLLSLVLAMGLIVGFIVAPSN